MFPRLRVFIFGLLLLAINDVNSEQSGFQSEASALENSAVDGTSENSGLGAGGLDSSLSSPLIDESQGPVSESSILESSKESSLLEEKTEHSGLQGDEQDESIIPEASKEEVISSSLLESSGSPFIDDIHEFETSSKGDDIKKDTHEKSLEETEDQIPIDYSPKSHEESILLLEDPNYTVDDALRLLKKQRKIQQNALERSKGASFLNMYDFEDSKSPITFKYGSVSPRSMEKSFVSKKESSPELQDEELGFFPKELSPPRIEDEKETSPFIGSGEPSTSEISQRASEKSVGIPDKVSEESEILSPYNPISEENVLEEPFHSPEPSIKIKYSESEKTGDGGLNAEASDEDSNRVSSEVIDENEQEQTRYEIGNENEEGSSKSSEASARMEGASSELRVNMGLSDLDGELSEDSKLSLEQEAEVSKAQKQVNHSPGSDTEYVIEESSPEIVQEGSETSQSLQRKLLENREELTEDPFSQDQEQGRLQDPENSHELSRSGLSSSVELSNVNIFTNEHMANQLRGILLPLAEIFQIALGCAAPCHFRRYFIQTDRVLKNISKFEAKVVEISNIIKKAREITIKEVSDFFKFHQTAIKRRALLFVQKYLKSIRLLHLKIESARKTVLFALKTRILLQLLPNKYAGEYSNEELSNINSHVEFVLKEYESVRSQLGSKTLKFGLMKYLSLNDYDPTIEPIKIVLESELRQFLSKMPTFQKFSSKHRRLASALHEMMEKAGFPITKRFFMIDRKGLTKEQQKLYKKKVKSDEKQFKSRLGKKEYVQFKKSREQKWTDFNRKVGARDK
ncbi:transcription regulator XNP/ATRX, DEAD-box superfamily [Cryptosporidium felis]|nr:transcription regulator XNP/ATRX, DEAD-box superfamily [Cryptosporidium felis]